MNAYNTDAYHKHIEEYFTAWLGQCQPTDIEEASYSFDNCKVSVQRQNYEGICNGVSVRGQKELLEIFVNDTHLCNYVCSDNTFIYMFEYNDDDYLIFNKHLYGYTILNLKTKEEYNYFPSLVANDKGEAFIIANATKIDSFLVLEGCYWACPYEYYLIDLDTKKTLRLQSIFDGNDHSSIGIRKADDIVQFCFEEGSDASFSISELKRLLKESITSDI